MKNELKKFRCIYFLAEYFIFITIILTIPVLSSASEKKDLLPVKIGLTAEFGLRDSFSAQAVEMGIRAAIYEINQQGGVLGGRPLALETKDDRSVPARAIQNIKDFNAMSDMVAVFGARFSPVLVELIPLVHEIGMILLDPWASADIITSHERKPSYSFRLSLKDSLAMPAVMGSALKRGMPNIGMILPNTAWGRSNFMAAESFAAANPGIKIVRFRWYNWGDASLVSLYKDVLSAGAQAVIMVANDLEGSILVNEIASLPGNEILPILSHWGVTGGNFFQKTQDSLKKIDFSLVQTFSFFKADPVIRERFMALAEKLYGIKDFKKIEAPVGVGHAYDLTHLLAKAIDQAGSTDRAKIRTALENLGPYAGLSANLSRPFTPENHDALGIDSVFMAEFDNDGVIVPMP